MRMAATIRSGICALYWFVIAFVIVSFLSVPVQASVLHFLNSFRCVCADSVLNDFIGRILQMDFHMLPVLLVGFSGTEGGSDFVNTFWILRETFLRPEKKTSILTHIAVYERSGLGHRK